MPDTLTAALTLAAVAALIAVAISFVPARCAPGAPGFSIAGAVLLAGCKE